MAFSTSRLGKSIEMFDDEVALHLRSGSLLRHRRLAIPREGGGRQASVEIKSKEFEEKFAKDGYLQHYYGIMYMCILLLPSDFVLHYELNAAISGVMSKLEQIIIYFTDRVAVQGGQTVFEAINMDDGMTQLKFDIVYGRRLPLLDGIARTRAYWLTVMALSWSVQ